MGTVVITPGRTYPHIIPNRWIRTFTITGSASYANPGGDTISASGIETIMGTNVNDLTYADQIIISPANTGHNVWIDVTTAKVKFFNGTTEIANAVPLSTVIAKGMVLLEDAHMVNDWAGGGTI